MTYMDRLYEVIADFLRYEKDIDVQKVIRYDERQETEGYCNTCSYTYMVVNIYYHDQDANTNVFKFRGSLADLLTYA